MGFLSFKSKQIDKEFIKKINSDDYYDLLMLDKNGCIIAKAIGQSITNIRASVENQLDIAINLIITPGTYFIARGDCQNMAVRKETIVHLFPKTTKEIQLEAVCINANLSIPGKYDYFEGVDKVSKKLYRFLQYTNENTIHPMSVQAGVWAISDKFNREKIKKQLHSTSQSSATKTEIISDENVDEAMIVLWKLGIRTKLWNGVTLNGKKAKIIRNSK